MDLALSLGQWLLLYDTINSYMKFNAVYDKGVMEDIFLLIAHYPT